MSVRLITSEDLQNARDAVGFCYICGDKLKPDSSRPRDAIQDEHVVPKSILRLAPNDSESDRYPVILDVHFRCDSMHKAKNDNVIAAFSSMHSMPASKWGDKRPNQVKKIFSRQIESESGVLLPAVSSVEMRAACSYWVAGLHTALYGTFLVRRENSMQIFAPQPEFNSALGRNQMSFDSIASQMSEFKDIQRGLDQAIDEAIAKDQFDSVSAWGGMLEYKAVWSQNRMTNHYRDLPATCFWRLVHPGIEGLIKDVPGSLPHWSGYFEDFRVPEGATLLTDFLPS